MWSPHPGRDGDAPFLSHDYSVTSRFFRRQLVVADAFRDLEYFDVEASDVLTVAVHARNGDRLPGRKYEKHMHLNLPDAYYIAALEALLAVARRPVRVVVFSSAVEPPATSPRAAPRKPPRLLDHRRRRSAH